MDDCATFNPLREFTLHSVEDRPHASLVPTEQDLFWRGYLSWSRISSPFQDWRTMVPQTLPQRPEQSNPSKSTYPQTPRVSQFCPLCYGKHSARLPSSSGRWIQRDWSASGSHPLSQRVWSWVIADPKDPKDALDHLYPEVAESPELQFE